MKQVLLISFISKIPKIHLYVSPIKPQILAVYAIIREPTKVVYLLSNKLPEHEKYNMVQQGRRAGLLVKLNLAEGSSRKSEVERKRFFEISRGSLAELDAAFETTVDLNYFSLSDLQDFSSLLNKSFAMVSKMI